MFIIINTVCFCKCQFGGCVKPLCHSILTCMCLLFILVAFCDEKKNSVYLNGIFQHNCTYLTFDHNLTLNRKITLGIHPYIVCNSPRNNSSLDAKH